MIQHMRGISGRCGFLLIALLVLSACGPKIIQTPEWRLHGVKIGAVSASGATLDINVKVTNPNFFAIVVERVSYRLYFNDVEVAKGEKTGAFEFRPYQEAGMTLPLTVDLAGLLAQAPSLKSKDKAAYRIEGEATLNAAGVRKTFPFKQGKGEGEKTE